jgi:hypothetical protein
MNYPKARCQCVETCENIPLKGEAFCEKHMKEGCPRIAPLSGWEPKYEPWRWNSKKEIRLTHNCFSYAFNILDIEQVKACLSKPSCDVPFHQPGSVSGYPKFTDADPKTCPNIIVRLQGDNPSILPTTFEEKCPKGTSKIALIGDEDQDYHFLVQNQPKEGETIGYFSQKSGALPVTDKDAKGHRIYDVQLANHNFKKHSLNYDRFCGYFCIPRDRQLFVKVGGSKRPRVTRRRRK